MRSSWTLRLFAASLLLGGLRDPRLGALGEAAVFAALWLERPALGPAVAWLPWLGWALLSGLSSRQPLAALPELAHWFAALGFFSIAAAWDERDRENWLKALLAVCAVLAAAAVWTGIPRHFHSAMTGLIPPYYNYTAFALAAGAAAAAAWALHPRGPRGGLRIAAGVFAVAGASCIALAHSRGAALALVFAAGVWAARRWGPKVALFLALAAGLAGGAVLTHRIPAALGGVLDKPERQLQEARPQIWRRAAGIAGEGPWLGEGPGSFGVGFRRRPVESVGARSRWGLGTEYAHSEILQAAAETGWAGLALWLIGFGAALSVLLRRAEAEPAREAAAVAVAAMAIQLTIDNMLQVPGLAFLFFSALAVARARPSGGRQWPRTAAATGVVLALVAWIPRALAASDPARAAVLFPRESDPREDLAYRAMAGGNADEADARWAEAAERAPFNAVYPWRRAQIAAARGHWAEAEEFARRAAEDEPGFLSDRVLRAEALVHLGRAADARAELAAVEDALKSRGEPAIVTHYDEAIWDFDRPEYNRVAALAGSNR